MKWVGVQLFHLHEYGVTFKDAPYFGKEYDFLIDALEERITLQLLLTLRSEKDDPYFVLQCSKPKETEETPEHCLWGCACAQEVWRWFVGILACVAPDLGLLTWGVFYWCSMAEGYHLAFEADPQDLVYLITQGTWRLIEGIPQHLTERDAGT